MILQCSECKARYLVPDQAIGAEGRNVRCARCKHTWFQDAAPEADRALDELDKMLGEISAGPRPVPPGSNLPAPRDDPAPLGLRLSVFSAAVAALALLLLIVRPGLLGLPSTNGLALADVGISRVGQGDKAAYTINGKISNGTERAAPMPGLRLTMVDKDGNALRSWNVENLPKGITPGGAAPFAIDRLEVHNPSAARFVIEIGSPLELALRRKPG